MSRKRLAADTAGAPWMLTFSDTAMLLLVFYVMRFATMNLANADLHSRVLSGFPSHTDTDKGDEKVLSIVQADLDDLNSALSHQLPTGELQEPVKPQLSGIETEVLDGKLEYRFNLWGAFDDNNEIRFRDAAILQTALKTAKANNLRIALISHTTAEPVWEVSQSQLMTAARQMIDAGVEFSLFAAGNSKLARQGVIKGNKLEIILRSKER
jgi:hypothetical protein